MEHLQQFVNGLTLGAIYALIALGYTLVYGVLRLINFAHGDVYMLGAYAGLFAFGAFSGHAGIVTVPLVIIAAMLACAVAGAFIERFAYRPLRQAPRLSLLITAIGVSFLLEYGGQIVFSPDTRGYPELLPTEPLRLPAFISWKPAQGVLNLISGQQIIIVISALLLMLGLQWLVTRTRLGRAMRAVSLDRDAASLMGINTDNVIAFTFALGSALAAAAGVLNAAYSSGINPLSGLLVGLKAFVAAVLGGIGSIPGAVLGGLLIGFVETFVKSQPALTQYADAVVFSVLILVLLVRPAGLLGRATAEKV